MFNYFDFFFLIAVKKILASFLKLKRCTDGLVFEGDDRRSAESSNTKRDEERRDERGWKRRMEGWIGAYVKMKRKPRDYL